MRKNNTTWRFHWRSGALSYSPSPDGIDPSPRITAAVRKSLIADHDGDDIAGTFDVNGKVRIERREKRITTEEPLMPCIDCGTDTHPKWPKRPEYYMVHDEVWLEAGMPVYIPAPDAPVDWDDGKDDEWPGNFLCIGCLENRLDRRLTHRDFKDVPINRDVIPGFYRTHRTRRLAARLKANERKR